MSSFNRSWGWTTVLTAFLLLLASEAARAQIRVACVGDSITYGVNLPSNQTYPADLQSALGSGYNVQNFGYPGLSLMSLPGGNPSYHPAYTSTTYYTSAQSFNPNIVIIMLGTNDASFAPNSGQTWSQTYNALFISQYKDLINSFRNLPSHPVVYVNTCCRVVNTNQYGIDPTILNTTVVPDLYQIASSMNCPVIDVYSATSPYGSNFGDNVHPDVNGALIIANAVKGAVQNYGSNPPVITAAPSAAKATPGNGVNVVTWTTPSGWVTSYNIYRGTTTNGQGTTPYATAVPGTTPVFTDNGLTNGTTYYYKVTAVNSAGESAKSTEVNAKPAATAYAGSPYGGTAAAVPGTILLDKYDIGGQGVAYNYGSTWNYGGQFRFYDGVGIEVCSDTGGGNGYDLGWTYAGQWTNYTVNVATAGTYTVTFRVASGGTGGTFHLQNAVGTNLTGTVTAPGTGGWQTWTNVTANVTLPAGTQVLRLVQDSGGYNLNFMTIAGATAPAAPTGVSATAGNAQATISWTAPAGVVTSYNLYRGTTSGGQGTTAYKTGLTSTSYVDTGLTNGTTYYYKVTAVNSAGESARSSEVSAKPVAQTQAPYGGTPWPIPGKIAFPNYDLGGQGLGYSSGGTTNPGGQYRNDGVGIEICSDTDTGNGYDVGWTAAGQWLNYTVNVATAGTYTVTFRVASGASGGTFHLQNAAGTNLTGTVSVPGTGGWQYWTSVTATVTLPAGQQILRFVEDTGGYNLNYMSFASTTGNGPLADGNYILHPQNATGSSLDADGSGTANGTKVQIWQTTGASNQIWHFVNKGNGKYLIQPSYNLNLCLDVQNNSSANGTLVQLWAPTGANNQLWTLAPVAGGYTITPVNAPGARLDVSGPSSANGTQIQIWQASGGTNQTWSINPG